MYCWPSPTLCPCAAHGHRWCPLVSLEAADPQPLALQSAPCMCSGPAWQCLVEGRRRWPRVTTDCGSLRAAPRAIHPVPCVEWGHIPGQSVGTPLGVLHPWVPPLPNIATALALPWGCHHFLATAALLGSVPSVPVSSDADDSPVSPDRPGHTVGTPWQWWQWGLLPACRQRTLRAHPRGLCQRPHLPPPRCR